MATSGSTITFITDQMANAGTIVARKMFGEYGIYCDGVIVALVCDNELYVKPTVSGRAYIGDVTEGCAYPGAKPSFMIGDRIDDGEWLAGLIKTTKSELARNETIKTPSVRKKRKRNA